MQYNARQCNTNGIVESIVLTAALLREYALISFLNVAISTEAALDADCKI